MLHRTLALLIVVAVASACAGDDDDATTADTTAARVDDHHDLGRRRRAGIHRTRAVPGRHHHARARGRRARRGLVPSSRGHDWHRHLRRARSRARDAQQPAHGRRPRVLHHRCAPRRGRSRRRVPARAVQSRLVRLPVPVVVSHVASRELGDGRRRARSLEPRPLSLHRSHPRRPGSHTQRQRRRPAIHACVDGDRARDRGITLRGPPRHRDGRGDGPLRRRVQHACTRVRSRDRRLRLTVVGRRRRAARHHARPRRPSWS